MYGFVDIRGTQGAASNGGQKRKKVPTGRPWGALL